MRYRGELLESKARKAQAQDCEAEGNGMSIGCPSTPSLFALAFRVSGAFKDTAAKIAEGAGQDLHKDIEGLISRTKEGAWCKLVYIYIYIYIYIEREREREREKERERVRD